MDQTQSQTVPWDNAGSLKRQSVSLDPMRVYAEAKADYLRRYQMVIESKDEDVMDPSEAEAYLEIAHEAHNAMRALERRRDLIRAQKQSHPVDVAHPQKAQAALMASASRNTSLAATPRSPNLQQQQKQQQHQQVVAPVVQADQQQEGYYVEQDQEQQRQHLQVPRSISPSNLNQLCQQPHIPASSPSATARPAHVNAPKPPVPLEATAGGTNSGKHTAADLASGDGCGPAIAAAHVWVNDLEPPTASGMPDGAQPTCTNTDGAQPTCTDTSSRLRHSPLHSRHKLGHKLAHKVAAVADTPLQPGQPTGGAYLVSTVVATAARRKLLQQQALRQQLHAQQMQRLNSLPWLQQLHSMSSKAAQATQGLRQQLARVTHPSRTRLAAKMGYPDDHVNSINTKHCSSNRTLRELLNGDNSKPLTDASNTQTIGSAAAGVPGSRPPVERAVSVKAASTVGPLGQLKVLWAKGQFKAVWEKVNGSKSERLFNPPLPCEAEGVPATGQHAVKALYVGPGFRPGYHLWARADVGRFGRWLTHGGSSAAAAAAAADEGLLVLPSSVHGGLQLAEQQQQQLQESARLRLAGADEDAFEPSGVTMGWPGLTSEAGMIRMEALRLQLQLQQQLKLERQMRLRLAASHVPLLGRFVLLGSNHQLSHAAAGSPAATSAAAAAPPDIPAAAAQQAAAARLSKITRSRKNLQALLLQYQQPLSCSKQHAWHRWFSRSPFKQHTRPPGTNATSSLLIRNIHNVYSNITGSSTSSSGSNSRRRLLQCELQQLRKQRQYQLVRDSLQARVGAKHAHKALRKNLPDDGQCWEDTLPFELYHLHKRGVIEPLVQGQQRAHEVALLKVSQGHMSKGSRLDRVRQRRRKVLSRDSNAWGSKPHIRSSMHSVAAAADAHQPAVGGQSLLLAAVAAGEGTGSDCSAARGGIVNVIGTVAAAGSGSMSLIVTADAAGDGSSSIVITSSSIAAGGAAAASTAGSKAQQEEEEAWCPVEQWEMFGEPPVWEECMGTMTQQEAKLAAVVLRAPMRIPVYVQQKQKQGQEQQQAEVGGSRGWRSSRRSKRSRKWFDGRQLLVWPPEIYDEEDD